MRTAKQFLFSTATILILASVGFGIRMIFYGELGWQFHFKLWWISMLVMLYLWESVRFLNAFLNRIIPFEKLGFKRMIIQIIITVIFVFLSRYFLLPYARDFIPFQLQKLTVITFYIIDFFIALSLNVGFFAHYFLNQWKASIQRAERLEKEKTQVQYHNLINQLNPHFLFNSLSSLQSLIEENPKLASQFLQQLSKVYRYVLQNKEKELVSIQTEKDFLVHYVSLLRTRFDGQLLVKFGISDSASGKMIVPVTLQILIENAVKHNSMSGEHPLIIEITDENNFLVVKNNKQKKSKVESSNRQGLEDLKNLYGFLSKEEIKISENENEFSIRLPLLEK